MSNDSSAADPRLADFLDAMTATLVARSLEYMPHDEFWERRYAARAGRFANEDGAFHMRYLADAVRAGSPTVMAQYGKWLRDLLVPRGMCTLHLIEHFENLSRAIEVESGTAPAVRYLQAGIDALAYANDSPAGAVQHAADAIDQKVPSLEPLSGSPRNSAWETRYLCHYAADALSRTDAALLAKHVSWARSLYVADGGPVTDFDAWIDAIVTALGPANIPSGFLRPREIHN